MEEGRRKDPAAQDAQVFLDRNHNPYSQRAPAHVPSLQELQSTSFQAYVRNILFGNNENSKKRRRQGMAKVTLPKDFCHSTSYVDTTARGPEWQEGSALGDLMIDGPIKQCLSGIGGVYEYTLLDQKALPLYKFRQVADAFQQRQLGTTVEQHCDSLADDDVHCDALATKFWKRLGPTMESSMYGADMEGSLFDKDDDACGWNLGRLESCLQLLSADTDGTNLPGVTTPYLYVGMWASVFCAHTEDMNLLSINYLHAGAPKYWYAIAPEDAKRFESLAESRFVHASRDCREFLRHKRYLLSPAVLQKAGVPYTTQIQRPGDAILTMPGGYHFGINLGFNVAEATNFAVPEWIDHGKQARFCMCRPDSVRIDMNRFQELMNQYEQDVERAQKIGCTALSYRQWTLAEAKRKEQPTVGKKRKKKRPKDETYLTSQEVVEDQLIVGSDKRKAFVIEVTRPVSSTAQKAVPKNGVGNKKRRKKCQEVKEEWRIAKPGRARSFRVQTKVLVLMPGKAVGGNVEQRGEEDDDDEEQCFAGEIREVADNCVRVHFAGLTKREDVWMPHDSPKMFLDGGIMHYD